MNVDVADDCGMRQSLSASGFQILRGCQEKDLLGMAATCGVPVAEPRDGILVKPLRPVSASTAPRNTLSARYGQGRFPLHTEAAYWREPPRFVLLFCVDPGDGRQATVLLDADPLVRSQAGHVLNTSPWLVSSGVHPFLSSVVSGVYGRRMLRFDRECMRPLTSPGYAFEAQIEKFIEISVLHHHQWQAGDLLVLDNWRMLHGRGPAAAPSSSRLLLKVMARERLA